MIQEQPLLVHAKERWQKFLVVLAAFIHGALILYLPLSAPSDIHNSPDETANVLVIQNVKERNSVRVAAPTSGLPSRVAPRSLHRQDNAFIPVGFPAFPLFSGVAAKLFTFKGLAYMSAFLSMLSVLAFYGAAWRFFGTTVGIISAILYGAHPAVLYWGSRPFAPHALVGALSIFAIYFLVRALRIRVRERRDGAVQVERPTFEQPRVKRTLSSLMAGICAGLALSFRPPETLWLIPVFTYALAAPSLRRRLSFLTLISGLVVPLAGAFALNAFLYGSPLRTGYHLTPPDAALLQPLTAFAAPFGFDFAHTGVVAWEYLLRIFWWYAAAFIAGAALVMFARTATARRLRYLCVGVIILAAYLLQIYGSFAFQDRLDGLPSIGTSYTRYFLPLYILSIPLAAFAVRKLGFAARARAALPIALGVMAFLSFNTVFRASDESIYSIRDTLKENRAVREQILALTAADAIIFTERGDKIIFPHREVATTFLRWSQDDFEAVRSRPLYLETIADREFIAWQNRTFFEPHGLRAIDPVDLGGRHVIYRLEQSKQIKH